MQDCSGEIELIQGIPEAMRDQAVSLYDDAFGGKFAAAVPSPAGRRSLLRRAMNLEFAIGAVDGGELVGLAGYETPDGSLTDGITWTSLKQSVGLLHGLRAAMVLSLYERSLRPRELLMDGIAVNAGRRGHGIGTRLLDHLATFAKSSGFDSIRLDVVDTNPRARQLYERNGFVATETVQFSFLRWLLGFGESTTLVRHLRETE